MANAEDGLEMLAPRPSSFCAGSWVEASGDASRGWQISQPDTQHMQFAIRMRLCRWTCRSVLLLARRMCVGVQTKGEWTWRSKVGDAHLDVAVVLPGRVLLPRPPPWQLRRHAERAEQQVVLSLFREWPSSRSRLARPTRHARLPSASMDRIRGSAGEGVAIVKHAPGRLRVCVI